MQVKHGLLTLLGSAGILAIFSTAVYAAGSGYTPTTNPVPSGTPGGYSQVVTAATISPTSTTPTTVSVKVDNTPATIVVAPGTFSQKVQVVVTSPVLSQVTSGVSSLGYAGYSAVAGIGINVVNSSGQPYSGTFLKPVSITVNNSAIEPGDRVVEWNAQGTFSTVSSATVSAGKASWSFQQDPAFAILAPKPGVVPGATSPVTGKPFVKDALIGMALISGGSVLFVRTRRRRLS
ncbi:hypothetical protein [Sulfobacillus thermosulfidooxidans]|uniref:hypothetical protein n=1 Tax=Sulfobacillus thermosulfidooxidans TaxID=28034 RepID=UPI000306E413|nr:hypothetical protein [Sulfobacillus thermosulfidooxidans]